MPTLFLSKKFQMSIAGVISIVLSHYLGISEEKTMMIAGLCAAYLGAQGLADWGKEAKKIEKQ